MANKPFARSYWDGCLEHPDNALDVQKFMNDGNKHASFCQLQQGVSVRPHLRESFSMKVEPHFALG